MYPIVELQPATAAETRLAYEEVKDFGITDMGRGDSHRYAYRMLSEPELTEELCRLSSPSTLGRIDSVTFQPCKLYDARSQDRYDVQLFTNAGGSWTLTAIFDGHLNHDTVDYVACQLPQLVRRSLDELCRTPSALCPGAVSDVLSRAITSLDEALLSDFQTLFPGGEGFLIQASSDRLRKSINDVEGAGTHFAKVARVLGGTTVLITLFSESTEGLWVANLGDCCAGTKNGTSWQATIMNSIHNGSNDLELQRIRCEHHGEPECIVDRRVLGWLAPTRAIGDAWLKLPAVYTKKVFAIIDAPWMQVHSLDKYIHRIKSPPYVSASPDVYYHRLRGVRRQSGPEHSFLILCSDGLVDLHSEDSPRPIEALANRWVQVVGRHIDEGHSGRCPRVNLALRILRDAIGGEDAHLSSRILTVEMEEKWIDDTTIIVQRFM